MSTDLLEMMGGFVLSALIAWFGYRRASLSGSGMVGAWIVGTLIFGLGGWEWGLLLIGFFVTSSALSHYRGRDKERLAEKFAKGGRRDLAQTLANGGWGAVLAVLRPFFPAHEAVLFAAYVGAMAAVNADTWATELGVLSQVDPRLITTGRRVPVGTSGGVSVRGSGAALLGASFIAVLAALARVAQDWSGGVGDGGVLWLILAGSAAGLGGSFLDSLLGATVQGIYYCDVCQKETERQRHRCGQETRLVRGWRWLGNDSVNFIASVVGSVLTGLFWSVLMGI